jgi:hypothetical protein
MSNEKRGNLNIIGKDVKEEPKWVKKDEQIPGEKVAKAIF